MMEHTIKVRASQKWYKLVIFGDWHIGHECCDIDAIKAMVKYIKSKDPKEYGVIVTGDLIENVLPTTKGSLFETNIPNPADQAKLAVQLLKPIAKSHCIVMLSGNHEERTQRVAGFDPGEFMSDKLGIPYYGYHAMVKLNLQAGKKPAQSYTIYAEHGAGAIPRRVSGRYTRLESTSNRVIADIYVKGHIHHKLAFPKTVWREIDGTVVKRKIMFASNGAYLIDPEYGVRSGYDPTESGVAKLDLATDRFDVHAHI